MNAKLFEIVFERLAESQLSGEESNLVLAACQGDEALQSWLSEGLAPNLEGRVARVETGPGAYLQAKHLLRRGEQGLAVFAPVFAAFVARERHVESKGESLRVDTERGDVYVNGRPIPPLTDLEYRLLALLNDRRGQILDKYQIVEKVWGESYIDQVDDDRIERLVARVREKIEPDPRQPRFLTTVRGRGYRLKTE